MIKKIFIKTLPIYFLLFQVSILFGQEIKKISNKGISQFGNDFSLNGKYYAYTEIEFNKKNSKFEYGTNIISVFKPNEVYFHSDTVKFIGFLRDSLIVGLNKSNKLCTFNTVKKNIVNEYSFILNDDIYTSFNFIFRNNTLYYLSDNSIKGYNINTRKDISLVTLKDLPSSYSSIVSFDIKNDTVALCLYKYHESKDSYDFYLYNLSTQKYSLIKSGSSTTEKMYSPIIRFSFREEIVYSYYKEDGAYLYFLNSYTFGESKKQYFNNYKIMNFSINNLRQEYVSLFNEESRNKIAKEHKFKHGIGALLGGCSVYLIQ